MIVKYILVYLFCISSAGWPSTWESFTQRQINSSTNSIIIPYYEYCKEMQLVFRTKKDLQRHIKTIPKDREYHIYKLQESKSE